MVPPGRRRRGRRLHRPPAPRHRPRCHHQRFGALSVLRDGLGPGAQPLRASARRCVGGWAAGVGRSSVPGPGAVDRPGIATAPGSPLASWVDDEITGADRAWVVQHDPGPALLHRRDPRRGLRRRRSPGPGDGGLRAATVGH
ncbi:hypothetical protein [Streptacidiphilus sp. N1-5]|uniref:Uncharacterized protein n=1 Tax=Streptacidiphilus cavernicola TaxID=3342716 RepID=A0ABV6V1E4_9ACTN